MTPEQFKAARLAAGLTTQEAVADALEVDRRTVGRWERGEVPVPGPVRVALRLMLQTSPSPAAHPEMPAVSRS
jgi:transcriptional regulator with XRE-family HTH domain